METIQIYLVDRSRLNREGLKRLLDSTDLAIIGDAADLEGLRRDLERGLDPDCVVLHVDHAKDGVSAFVAAGRKLVGAARRLVCLGSQLDPEVLQHAFAAGADALLNEDSSNTVMLRSLHLVMLGEKVFPSALIGKLVQDFIPHQRAAPACADARARLTQRETEILRSLAVGDANKVIANRLDINEATVKTHVKNIQRKLQVSNRTQAAVWALHHGLAAPQGASPSGSALQVPHLLRPGSDHG